MRSDVPCSREGPGVERQARPGGVLVWGVKPGDVVLSKAGRLAVPNVRLGRSKGPPVGGDLETVQALERVGAERGRGILELAVGGLASIPGVASVIAGATSPEQVRANAAAGAWHASDDDLDAIARAVP